MRTTHATNWTSWAVLLTAAVLTACATQAVPTGPDTPRQSKVRGDLEQCNTAGGNKAHSLVVSPDGKYEFQTTGINVAQAVLDCMTSKGYSAQRVDNPMDHGGRDMIRSGGKGQ